MLEDWEIHQMDVKSAFLHGNLDEEIYMEQPIGFIVAGQEHVNLYQTAEGTLRPEAGFPCMELAIPWSSN